MLCVKRAVEQFNGREDKQRLCFVLVALRALFAPRHLSRYMFRGEI